MLSNDNAVLVIIDVQGKLAQLAHRKEDLFANLQRCIKGAKALKLPVIWLEQNPEGLGPSIPEVSGLLSGQRPIGKFCFSCCGSEEFMKALRGTGRKQVLLTGIETHVCVYQTSVDLLGMGYEVQVVSDAVSSRTPENKQIGLDRIRQAGGNVTSTEMALFEMLKEARGETFKEILRAVK